MNELMISTCPELLASKPALVVEPNPRGEGYFVCARNLDAGLVASLGERAERLLRVTVTPSEAQEDLDLPDMLGEREVRGGEVHFLPNFPFEPGIRYRAILDLGLLGQPGLAEVLTREFSLPRQAPQAEPEVTQVFPSGGVFPGNLLRFYVRFSNPMRRGHAEANIDILDQHGRRAPDVLYRVPVELWDSRMRCLTVLLDPGRLKRGVGPNRMLGLPLTAGQRYTLMIRPGMTDVYGCPLRKSFSKSFMVSEAVREPIAIERWIIAAPSPNKREPLELTFALPLDWAELWQGIIIASANGEPVSGQVDVEVGETRWRFTPDAPWAAGSYSIRVSPGLEDVCGNTPGGAFDGPFRSSDEVVPEPMIRSVPFEVKGPADDSEPRIIAMPASQTPSRRVCVATCLVRQRAGPQRLSQQRDHTSRHWRLMRAKPRHYSSLGSPILSWSACHGQS